MFQDFLVLLNKLQLQDVHSKGCADLWWLKLWCMQSSWVHVDLNPMDNLWTTLKSRVCAKKPIDLTLFYQSNIQPELCQKFVDGYQKHLIQGTTC